MHWRHCSLALSHWYRASMLFNIVSADVPVPFDEKIINRQNDDFPINNYNSPLFLEIKKKIKKLMNTRHSSEWLNIDMLPSLISCGRLTHWPLGYMAEILNVWFSNTFWLFIYWWIHFMCLSQCYVYYMHYLNQYWQRSVMPYGVTMPQWVNSLWHSAIIWHQKSLSTLLQVMAWHLFSAKPLPELVLAKW